MNIPAEFDEIRPYTPEELPQVFEELLSDSSFQAVMAKIMPGVPQEVLAAQLKQCKTNLDVQKNLFYKLLYGIIREHSDGFDMDTSSILDKQCSYTFISNHRDIVLVYSAACAFYASDAGVFCQNVEIHSLRHYAEARERVDCSARRSCQGF